VLGEAVRVYAVTGVPPEVQAYAMARYSRSAQSMRESVAELSAQRAEEFLNTFYFQYGHRSIADLAHLAIAVEDISILAAIRVVDEPLWDGQERSTRYQDFRRSGYVVPDAVAASSRAEDYRRAADALFAGYEDLFRQAFELLAAHYPRPADMEPAAYRRTLRARAFDLARYLLPLATRTSVGQVTSARVLERQIARLLADPLPEARAVGEALHTACREPAYDLTRERLRAIAEACPDARTRAALAAALAPEPLAPTLVKHIAPDRYAAETYHVMTQAAREVLGELPPDTSRIVDLVDPAPPEEELVATLLYRADPGGRSYRQVLKLVRELSPVRRRELLDLSFQGRGPHDEWLREHRAGYAVTFDLLLDIGAFRDLHRHRRCVQVIPPITGLLGRDDAATVVRRGLGAAGDEAVRAGLADRLAAALDAGVAAAAALRAQFPVEAAYLLPLGARMRALFKMDLAEAAYIIELRTGPTGHFSYRWLAWEMYQALRARHPTLAAHIRAQDPAQPVDMLRR
jgi:thymidylate synthase ThyX